MRIIQINFEHRPKLKEILSLGLLVALLGFSYSIMYV